MKNLLLSAALLLTVAATATAQTAAPTTDRQKARAERKAAREAAKGEKMKIKMKSTTSSATAAPAPVATAASAMTDVATPAAAAPAYAKSNKTPQERAESKSRQLIRDFGISTEQAAKIVPILVEQNTTVDALKDKANTQGKSKEISMAMRAANEQADMKMRAVLTPEQFAAFVKAREERKAAQKAAEAK